MVDVELVYIPKDAPPVHLKLSIAAGSSITDVVRQSRLVESYPEVEQLAVGIFATQVTWDTVVKAGDRVELYRPLSTDPKEKRRQRARRR